MIIHIGHHKTGTSWMQKHVFVEELGFQQILDHAEVHRLINKIPYLAFDPDHVERVLDHVKLRIQRASDKNLVPVISSELLCGSPLDGGARSYENMKKIQCLFPDANILIGVRNQKDAICSIYNQWVKRGGTSSIRNFMTEGDNDYSHSRFSLSHYQYDRLVSAYIREFGKSRVYVLPYEMYQADKSAIYRFLGSFNPGLSEDGFAGYMSLHDRDINASLAPMAIPLVRGFNIFCRNQNHPYALLNLERFRNVFMRAVKFVFGGAGSQERDIKVIEDLSRGMFAGSNRALSICIGIELERYGYEV